MTVLKRLCCGAVPFLVLYCCDVSEAKDISSGPHGTTVDRYCVQCPDTCEEVCGTNCTGAQNMAGTLFGREKYAMNTDSVTRTKLQVIGRSEGKRC